MGGATRAGTRRVRLDIGQPTSVRLLTPCYREFLVWRILPEGVGAAFAGLPRQSLQSGRVRRYSALGTPKRSAGRVFYVNNESPASRAALSSVKGRSNGRRRARASGPLCFGFRAIVLDGGRFCFAPRSVRRRGVPPGRRTASKSRCAAAKSRTINRARPARRPACASAGRWNWPGSCTWARKAMPRRRRSCWMAGASPCFRRVAWPGLSEFGGCNSTPPCHAHRGRTGRCRQSFDSGIQQGAVFAESGESLCGSHRCIVHAQYARHHALQRGLCRPGKPVGTRRSHRTTRRASASRRAGQPARAPGPCRVDPLALGVLGVGYNGLPRIAGDSGGVLAVDFAKFDA